MTRALRSLGGGRDAPRRTHVPRAPITRDGSGWRADVDLPRGVTAAHIMGSGRNWLRARAGHWCSRGGWEQTATSTPAGLSCGSRQDLAGTGQPEWPLARSGRTVLFEPVPFGTDQRGPTVTFTLMFSSMVVGSMPRLGKTFAVRLLLSAAALDPRAEIDGYDLKGTGDLSRPSRPLRKPTGPVTTRRTSSTD